MKYLLPLLLLASCRTAAPIVGAVDAGSAGHRALVVRYDGDTFIAIGEIDAQAYVRMKGETAVYLAGPVTFTGGRVLIHSKSHDYKAELAIGQPWPAWVLETGLFTAKELQDMGVTLEAPL